MGHGDDSDFDPNVNGSVGSYPIASFDLSHVQLPLMVASWVVLVAYIKTVFHYSERVSKMVPESCLLVVLGNLFVDTNPYPLLLPLSVIKNMPLCSYTSCYH